MTDVARFIRFCESDFGTEVMDREADYITQHVSATDRILDVGCGIGSLEERLPDHDVLGLDRSQEMVQAARQRASAQFIRGDASRLPIQTETVDAVVFISTLEFIPDVEDVLEEATRILDPDGTLIGLVLNTRSAYVQSNLQRDGSYFQRMVHRDSDALTETILDHVDGQQEYILGVSGGTIVECTAPETAAISAVVGTPR